MKLDFSLDAAIIVTIISVLLFMIGQAYLSSFLGMFGADLAVLNLSVQDKLYWGFSKSIQDIINLLAGFIIFFIVIPYVFRQLGGSHWLLKIIRKIRCEIKTNRAYTPQIHNSSIEKKIERNLDYRLFIWYACFIAIVGTVYYIVHIQNYAKEAANKALLNSHNFKQVEIKQKPNQEAYKILCGQNLCAVLMVNGKQKSLHYIDPKDIAFFLN